MNDDRLLDDNPLREGFTGQYLAWKRLAQALRNQQLMIDALQKRVEQLERQNQPAMPSPEIWTGTGEIR